MLKSYDELRKIDVKPHCKKRAVLDYLNWSTCIKFVHVDAA